MNRQFKYTGIANSLDNHLSDYYESSNWIVCIWIGRVFNSKEKLCGEIEGCNQAFNFELCNNLVTVNRSTLSMYDGLGKTYRENNTNFPIPKYVCNFIRSLESKYVNK